MPASDEVRFHFDTRCENRVCGGPRGLATAPGRDYHDQNHDAEGNGHQRCALRPFPRRTEQQGVVGDKFFVLAPLRHPLRLVAVGQQEGLVLCAAIGGVHVDLVIRSDGCVAELRRGQRRGSASLVWEGALQWKNVMEPLREQPSMERHFASMRLGDARKLRPQAHVEEWRHIVKITHISHQREDLVGTSQRATDCSLHVVQHGLALAHATHEVVRPRNEAVRRALHVVWDDDLLATQGGRFVQSTKLAQVLFRLAEAPLTIGIGTVEV
mmetsp:Transcript_18096/g.49631  ORF Transcript_18096/g.49631 Transcript_18096/m.49631 type:complete len:269 (+) Transcript_18096:98-904(+)